MSVKWFRNDPDSCMRRQLCRNDIILNMSLTVDCSYLQNIDRAAQAEVSVYLSLHLAFISRLQ